MQKSVRPFSWISFSAHLKATRYLENKSINELLTSAINLLSNGDATHPKTPLFRLYSRIFRHLDKIFLFPLDGSAGFGGQVIQDTVDALDLIGDPVGDML